MAQWARGVAAAEMPWPADGLAVLAIVLLLAGVGVRWRVEEAVLGEELGEAYRADCRRTLPGVY